MSDSEKDVNRIIKIAEEEIKRTSEEAVKAALLEVNGELAYEKERTELLENYNKELQKEVNSLKEKNKKRIILGAALGGVGGVIIAPCINYFI